MISKKLWDGDRIVMVSDGILDAMPGAEKEAAFTDFLAGLPAAGPQETAEMIMAFALSFDGEPRDDMTVLGGRYLREIGAGGGPDDGDGLPAQGMENGR